MSTDPKPLTPKEFERRMNEIFPKDGYDNEGAHGMADDLMCELLTALGYAKGVKVFQDAEKWYA